MILSNAKWISAYNVQDTAVPEFFRDFKTEKPVKKAELYISAIGVYEAFINDKRVGNFILAPGWTSYMWRLQYQTYDVTDMLGENNRIKVYVGPGWANGYLGWMPSRHRFNDRNALIAKLVIEYEDGDCQIIVTDRDWKACQSPILESELYQGETYDANLNDEENALNAGLYSYTYDTLIPQEGVEIHEQEHIKPVAVFTTPAGEKVVDFGQEVAGYPTFTVDGKPGDEIEISFAEILDENDNFYTRNYRSAHPKIKYICKGGIEFYKPHLTYQGYRYIRLDKWPGKMETVEDAQVFTSIAINSEMKRIGHFESGVPLVNRFYENIVWSQKSNYMDVPTDCPQRDERLGWIGDAQIFARAGAFNFDTYQFMEKWLGDMRAEQLADGSIPEFIPYYRDAHDNELGWIGSTAWSDACIIIPWSLYLAYGEKKILSDNFDMMGRWIEFMRTHGDEEYLFCNNGIEQFGDWVALDAPEGTKVGATDLNLICSAYYAYSTGLYVKIGKALGKDMSAYEELYKKIVCRFREKFLPGGELTCKTPTAHVLVIQFELCEDPQKFADDLVKLLHGTNDHLITGFLGTAYIMHVLTKYGYSDLAYTLLLHTDYPSWLYQVTAGATTVWEHWDGIRPDKSRWDDEMNSFNHYAYGAVLDWMVQAACGLDVDENAPGYETLIFAPHADKRLGYAKAKLETKYGLVECGWKYEGDEPVYELTVPQGRNAKVLIADKAQYVEAGVYTFDKDGNIK